jgi:hypothetical protein
MPTRLLQLCAIILIATSFSYVDTSLRIAAGVQVTRTHTIYRIVPIAMVGLLSALAAHRQIGRILRQMLNPPILWWTWFAIVAIVSGFLSDIAPLWSAWKCTELLVAMFWASTVLVISHHEQSGRVVEKCFEAVIGLCYFISCWTLMFAISQGASQYLSGAERLQLDWPGINAINLSVMAAFAIVGVWLTFRRLNAFMVMALIAPPLIVIVMARSRTGLLGLALAGGYSIFTQRVKASYRFIFVGLMVAMLGVFVLNADMRENFRMSSLSELLKLSGRIQTEKGDSAWAECISRIGESPFIGHGFLNMTRFMYRGKRVVGDNGFLHALVSAGFVGALPMMCYAVGLFVVWFRMGAAGMAGHHSNRLFGFGSSAACIAFLKAMTTNSLTSSDFAMVLFLLSAAAVVILRQPYCRQSSA